ncbi:MAG: ATP-binding protein [Gemmataceae bacterium]
MAIPAVLIYFIRRRPDLPFPWIFWLFGAFILGCGTTHLMEVITTYHPVYWVSGLVKAFTAAVSLATVVALVPLTPRVLALRGPEELQREIELRRVAEDQLQRANLGLKKDVQERTAELVSLNAALRLSEAQLRQMADAMPQIVWVARPDGYVEYYNRRWYEFTGQGEAESVGQGWSSPLHEDDRERAQDRWAQSLRTGKPYEIEYRILRHDGAYRWFLGRALPVRDESSQVVRWFGTCTDIDDKKRAEEGLEQRVRERTAELAALNEALVRSNKDLEEFAYVASHDLQEPLRKIQSFGERLTTRCRAGLDDLGRDCVQRMNSAAARMQRLIHDLLMFSRVSTNAQPPGPVDLNKVAREALSDLEQRVQETGGKVHLGSLPNIRADATQMRQLLQNLIGNALKFHRPGVPPEVSVAGRIVRTPKEGNCSYCELIVRDNGIGFAPTYAERIFQVFQRLHGRGQYEGTGVGLAICRKIVERHGGSIVADSVPGQGATFTIQLPVEAPGGRPRPAFTRKESHEQADHDPGGR